MSEFTAGLLYRSTEVDKMDPLLDELAWVIDRDELNEMWNVVMIDMDAKAYLSEPETCTWPEVIEVGEQVKALSRTAPLLYFYNSDHGWGYCIFQQGREAARLDINYEADYQIAESQLTAAHPGQDIHEVCGGEEWTAATSQAQESDAYLSQLRQGIAAAHPEQFRVFDLPEMDLGQLESLLSFDNLLSALIGDDFQEPAETFKTLLAMEEMSWIS